MITPFHLVLAFALGWLACHLVGWAVHELRMRAVSSSAPPITRPSLTRSFQRSHGSSSRH